MEKLKLGLDQHERVTLETLEKLKTRKHLNKKGKRTLLELKQRDCLKIKDLQQGKTYYQTTEDGNKKAISILILLNTIGDPELEQEKQVIIYYITEYYEISEEGKTTLISNLNQNKNKPIEHYNGENWYIPIDDYRLTDIEFFKKYGHFDEGIQVELPNTEYTIDNDYVGEIKFYRDRIKLKTINKFKIQSKEELEEYLKYINKEYSYPFKIKITL
jgi:hypothetical protein